MHPMDDAQQRIEIELRAVREELTQLRAEQQRMMQSVDQLAQTFRNLAVHLGIAAEPYSKGSTGRSERDLPGFG
jgi:hypothetical protein